MFSICYKTFCFKYYDPMLLILKQQKYLISNKLILLTINFTNTENFTTVVAINYTLKKKKYTKMSISMLSYRIECVFIKNENITFSILKHRLLSNPNKQ